MCMQYVNRLSCSAEHLSPASSWAEVAPVCAAHFLLARKERKRAAVFWFLFLQQHQNINSGALGAHWKMQWAAALPFAARGKSCPSFWSMWSVSSLGKAFSPGKFSSARCQVAVVGEEGCCPGGHTGKNWASRMEYPYGISCLASGLEPDSLPEWQGNLPAEWWVPLTALLVLHTTWSF